MDTTQGWIALHRSIRENWIWDVDKFNYPLAWIDLLLSANHADRTISINKNPVTILRGQFHTSIVNLSKRWHWDRKTVTAYLTKLKREEMIDYSTSPNGTTITIVNYNKYQPSGIKMDSHLDNETDNELNDELHSTLVTNNNEKNSKNDNTAITDMDIVVDILSPYKLNDAATEAIIKTANGSTDKIRHAVDILKKSKKDIKNVPGFLISCIKENYTSVPYTSKSANSFHNFSERKYDYDALMKESQNR